MTGNDKHTTYKNGRLGDGLLLFYPMITLDQLDNSLT
jgi:hypothetical protein